MTMGNKMYKCKVCMKKFGAAGPCFLMAIDVDNGTEPNTCPFKCGPTVKPKWKEVTK